MSEGHRPRAASHAELEFKVVELAMVTDDELARVLNETTQSGEGWQYEGTQFAMRESSKRPAMAFLTFTRKRT